MIRGIPFALMLLLVVGSVVAVLVTAARERATAPDPGMGTVRRLFVYALAALALVAGANGAAWLLQAVVGALVGASELTRDATIALGVALTAVGLPAWLAFWSVAQRAVRAKPHEARFLLRQVYLDAVLVAALATAAVAAVELLAVAFGVAGRHPAAPASVLVVWLAVWAFHARVERAEPPATDAGRTLRLLYVYAVAVVALAALALATGSVLQQALDAAYRALVGEGELLATTPALLSVRARLAAAAAVVAGVVWWWYGHRLADPARDGWPRAAATYAFGVVPGAVAVVAAASVLLYQALQLAFGAGGAVARLGVLPGVLATVVVGGGVWAVHDARARAEAALDPARARGGRRTRDLLLAAIGLVALAVGLTQGLAAALGALAPAGVSLVGAPWRDPTILGLTLVAVGGPLWALAWRRLQRRAHADAEERGALARRLYLTIAFGVGVAVALVAASVALYEVVAALLGGRGLAVLWDARAALATTLVAAAVGGYHAALLREDRGALSERGAAPAPAGGPAGEGVRPEDATNALTAVVYAKDLDRVAAFYEHVAGLAAVERTEGFVVLRGGAAELTVVRIRPDLAAAIHVATPPAARTETPVKLVFTVPSLAAARVAAADRGGALQADEAAWTWHGFRRLDGVDPEGNVVQLRERAPA